MNYLGKTLVLLNLLLAVFFVTWATGIYMHKVDWGWKDPRKYLDTDRVPSEIDKRVALLQEALSDRDRALDEESAKNRKPEDYYKALQTNQTNAGGVAAAANDLAFYQYLLWRNHLWYNDQLALLQSSPDKIDVRRIKDNKGVIDISSDEKSLGQPVFGAKVTYTDVDELKGNKVKDVNKSYDRYRGDLKDVLDAIDTSVAATKSWIQKQQELTSRLNGTQDEAGKTVKVGLYRLLDHEFELQQQLRKEMVYLRPLWVRELVDAQLLLERYQGLLERKMELKGAK
jgi:hypothetical protein